MNPSFRTARLLALIVFAATGVQAVKPVKFLGRRDYAGLGPALVADLNGDKILDVVAISYGNEMYPFLGNGNGTFRQLPQWNSGWDQIYRGVAADLNGDGYADLVLSGSQQPGGPYGIGVCFGNGDGTFQTPVLYQTGKDSGLWQIALGDFNGDGIADILAVGADGLWLLTGKGAGVFNAAVLIPITGLGGGSGLVVADFGEKGKLSAAITDYGTGFMLILGNGDGTFQAPILYPITDCCHYIGTGDVNRDGLPDVLVTLDVPANNLLFLNNGKGGFDAPTQTPITTMAPMAVGDVNGDGIPDLVSADGSVSFGLGGAKFATPVNYAVEATGGESVVLADLRHNGLLDVVAGEFQAFSVLLNQGAGTFQDGEWMSVPGSGNCAAAGDFNGDGIPDLALPTNDGLVILLGTGNGSAPYEQGATIPLSGPGCPLAGDVNGDGFLDLIEGADSLAGTGIYLGNGHGAFYLKSITPIGPSQLALGDFNHDGFMDLISSANQLALGDGQGYFQEPVPFVPNPNPLGYSGIAVGDLNNDGWPDVMLSPSSGGTQMEELLNDQHGGFTETTITNIGGIIGVVLADINGDGNLDAICPQLGQTAIYLGNGLGGLTLSPEIVYYPGGDPAAAPTVADVNGDGIPDLLLPADGSVGIAYGNGDGTFQSLIIWGAAASEGQVFAQNLHGQPANLPDLAIPAAGGGVTVLINTAQK